MTIIKFSKDAMKTIKNFILVAFAATSIVACVKEEANNTDFAPKGEVVTFTGSVNSALTKTHIQYEAGLEAGEWTTLFTSSDNIVVNGVASTDAKAIEERTKITFSVDGVEAPYFAMSAAQEPTYNEETKTYTYLVSGAKKPQEYTRVTDKTYTSYQSNTDVLAAYGTEENLHFRHMSTFYAITVDENSPEKANIKTVYVRQGDGTGIAGTWRLKFDEENDYEPSLTLGNATSVIAFDCGDEGLAHGTTMIIGLPAYNYESGLIFTLKDVDGKFASYMVKPEKTMHADNGGVVVPFNPSFNPRAGVINSAKDWNAFAEFVNTNPEEKEDWEIYGWVGDGSNTIKLGADIDDSEVDLIPITAEFKYTLDGNGKTITRNNATEALFSKVSGEVKNLTVAGKLTLSEGGAPLVDILVDGGKITGCTNAMEVSFDAAAHGNVAGIVRLVYGGTIEGCTNSGTISAKVDVSAANYNAVVGGIASQIHASDYAVTIKNCKNTVSITLAPVSGSSNGTGMPVCGLGGIAGWIRSGSSIMIDNCDNSGAITLSAENVVSDRGFIAYSMHVGGVVGLSTPINATGNNQGLINTPNTTNGLNVTFKDCDNTAIVHNCGVNYSTTAQTNTKVFTGGLVGSLLGKEASYAVVDNCSNTGAVYTYDLTESSSSSRPGYCAVAGGLIGFGGYLDIKNTTVNCEVGSGKRPMVAMAGVIGFAERPFDLTDSNIYVSGYFQRFEGYKLNRAVVAVVPVKYNTNAMGMVPNIEGSTITNCKIGGYVLSHGTPLTSDDKSDLSASLTVKLFNSESKTSANFVCGQGFTANTGVTITGYTYWEGN